MRAGERDLNLLYKLIFGLKNYFLLFIFFFFEFSFYFLNTWSCEIPLRSLTIKKLKNLSIRLFINYSPDFAVHANGCFEFELFSQCRHQFVVCGQQTPRVVQRYRTAKSGGRDQTHSPGTTLWVHAGQLKNFRLKNQKLITSGSSCLEVSTTWP